MGKAKKEPVKPIQMYSRYNPDPKVGLTSEQVNERTSMGLVNVDSYQGDTTGKIIRSNIFTYFNIIFLIIAAVLLFERSYNNMTFLLTVVANTIVGIYQELRSKRELDKLRLVSAPETTVVRGGAQQRVPSTSLVLDDIVIFEAGNQICADAVVCSGELTVNESLVTGESDEVKKVEGDSLLSGSFVISGSASARLEHVGDESFASNLAREAKLTKKKQVPGMMRSLDILIKVIGITIIPFAFLMFWNQYVILGLTEKVSVENTAASIIGMIPEGLYLLTSIALAASTVRLARKRTLVHDMKCIEALARVDVICLDKTGTITEPEMQMREVIPVGEKSSADSDEIENIIGDFVTAMRADNETMSAMKKYFKGHQAFHKPSRILSFSSTIKLSAVDFGLDGSYILGAPEFILHGNDNSLKSLIDSHSSLGERVLLFAKYRYTKGGADDIFQGGFTGSDTVPLALVILSNGIRPQAPETFQYFTDQGVDIKVISGDSPLTVSTAAGQANIPGYENYIDVSTISSDEALAKAATEYTVFGRVKPEQKRVLIRALQSAGHTVAMTGDGVNDVLALKDADCGIAMASGSEAASNVADIVLLDSDFSCMPRVVAEGRRVINNIERSASLFLVKNIFSFVLSLISLISVSLYPLVPSQLSLVSTLMIGIPSFFLALEPNTDLVHGKFLRNVLFRAFPAAVTAVLLVEWSLLFSGAFSIGTDLTSTVAFYLYAFASFLMLLRVCRPMNAWHGILSGVMGVAFLAAVIVIPEFFGITSLNYGSALILVTLLLLMVPIYRIIQSLFSKAEDFMHKHAK